MRRFTHARTGRSISVHKDSRLERLVEADANWSEAKAQPTPPAKKTSKSASSKTEK